jgi:hypothetical protein
MFPPSRRRGLFIQISATLVLLAAAWGCLELGLSQPVGSGLILFLLAGSLLAAPVPVLLYRTYALLNSGYSIERDGLRLRWGLRAEDIPLPEIEWVRPASDLVLPLRNPFFSWPGALLGAVHVPDLGPVEFLASERSGLLLVATPSRIYAISPADRNGFLKSFRHTIELGSLEPLPSFSTRPTAFLNRVWEDRLARWLMVGGLVLSLMVFLSVALGLGGRAQISLGFAPDRSPLEPVPSAQVLLLPILASLSFALDLGLGFYFYRRDERRPIAYMLWGSGLAVPIVFLIATWFIL